MESQIEYNQSPCGNLFYSQRTRPGAPLCICMNTKERSIMKLQESGRKSTQVKKLIYVILNQNFIFRILNDYFTYLVVCFIYLYNSCQQYYSLINLIVR